MPDELLWVPAADAQTEEAFVLTMVKHERADGSLRVAAVGPSAASVERVVRRDVDAWPAGDGTPAMVTDLAELPVLHTPAILQTLRERYELQHAHATWIGQSILVWLDPGGPTPQLWAPQAMRTAAAMSDEPSAPIAEPHPYALGERALRAALGRGPPTSDGAPRPQAIIVHGEAGGGQLQLVTQLAHYWLWRSADPYGVHAGGDEGGELVRAAGGGGSEAAAVLAHGQHVLRSMGSARTAQHTSMPQFGQWLSMGLAADGGCASVVLNTFGLEASRVVDAAGDDGGNFHAYYAVLHLSTLRYGESLEGASAASTSLASDAASSPSGFTMLRSHEAAAEGPMRAAADLAHLRESLSAIGLSGRETAHFWCVLEGMLHLGNLIFHERVEGGTSAATLPEHDAELERCSELLGLPHLRDMIWLAEMEPVAKRGRGAERGSGVRLRRPARQAADIRRALMEALHATLFTLLTGRVNLAVARQLSDHAKRRGGGGTSSVNGSGGNGAELLVMAPPAAESVGAGTPGGLAALLSSYAAERLHAIFISRALAAEQRRYSDEGISWAEVPLPDRRAVVALLDGRVSLHEEVEGVLSASLPPNGAPSDGGQHGGVGEGGGGKGSEGGGGSGSATSLLSLLELHARGSLARADESSSTAAFCAELHRRHAASPALVVPHAAEQKGRSRERGRSVSQQPATFLIHHTGGTRAYDVRALLAESGATPLSHACKLTLLESSNLLLRQVGDMLIGSRGRASAGSLVVGGLSADIRRVMRSSSAAFTEQLRAALHACDGSMLRHVLCVAPNASEVPRGAHRSLRPSSSLPCPSMPFHALPCPSMPFHAPPRGVVRSRASVSLTLLWSIATHLTVALLSVLGRSPTYWSRALHCASSTPWVCLPPPTCSPMATRRSFRSSPSLVSSAPPRPSRGACSRHVPLCTHSSARVACATAATTSWDAPPPSSAHSHVGAARRHSRWSYGCWP